MRLLYVIFGVTLFFALVLISSLYFRQNLEKVSVVDQLAETRIALQNTSELLTYLDEWGVFGGEASYHDSVKKAPLRGARIRKIQLVFTSIPQESGTVSIYSSGEPTLIASYSTALNEANVLETKIFLNEEYLLETGPENLDIRTTELVMGELYRVFHPVGLSAPDETIQALNNFTAGLRDKKQAIFKLRKK